MGFDIGTIGQQAAGEATGGILGLALGGINDNRQYKQQERLQQLSIQGQKEMASYNEATSLDYWQKTGPEAQMKQLEAAGLNPALMYKQGGAGGQTLGTNDGNVSEAQAPKGGGEPLAMMQMALQNQMTQSQIELNKAQAANINADTQNKPKVGANIEASTASITQGINNQKAIEELTKVQTGIANIQKIIANNTKDDQTLIIQEQARQAIQITDKLTSEATITDAQAENIHKTIALQLTSAQLTNDNLTKQGNLTDAQINQISNSIAQKWQEIKLETQGMDNETRLRKLQEKIHDLPDSHALGINSITNIAKLLTTLY